MSSLGYDLIKELYEPILQEIETKSKIGSNISFSDYVKQVYTELINEEYSKETSMSLKLLSVTRTELDDLLLEIIFLNLYEQLTLILRFSIGKPIKE